MTAIEGGDSWEEFCFDNCWCWDNCWDNCDGCWGNWDDCNWDNCEGGKQATRLSLPALPDPSATHGMGQLLPG
jgi:hypothetical protein